MMRGLCGGMLSVIVALGFTGCTVCQQPLEDFTYAAYGGLTPRADMTHGRVGSAFSPAGVAPPAGEFDPLLPPPEYTPETVAPPADQATSTAFDPGDILASAPK